MLILFFKDTMLVSVLVYIGRQGHDVSTYIGHQSYDVSAYTGP